MANGTERIVAIVVTGGLLLVVLELVRRKRLMERYALLWLFAGVVLLVLAAWKGLLTTLSYKVGIHYPPSTLFVVAIGLGLVLLIHFSLAISRLTDQNKVLAQRLALLQQRVEAAERENPEQDRAPEASLAEARSRGDAERPRRERLSGTR
jgi:hypothetical protein